MHTYRYPKGRVVTHGFFFRIEHDLGVIKQRVFELWQPGVQVFKFESGYFLRLPKALPCFIDEASSIPLIKQFGGYSNVIWRCAEDIPGYTENSLWLVDGGTLVEHIMSAESQFDPSIWVDLGAYREQPMQTLGRIAKPIVKSARTHTAVRSVLNDAELKESKALKGVLDTLGDIKRSGAVSGKTGGAGIASVVSGFKAIFDAFSRDHSGRGGAAGSGKASRPNLKHQHQVKPQGLFSRIMERFSHIAMASSLGKIIGRAQAKYVQKLMEQLSRGDIDEALKNAIPLSNLQDALHSRRTALGQLSRRSSLSISPYTHGSSSSVSLEEEVLESLRRMYEAAFRRMDVAGNVKKAAFILAELLRDIDRAVTYLEKHGQFVLAAELAEGQNLEPAQVIRQWIIAGDTERAMHVAVVSGSYEEAITALEAGHLKEANFLRWHVAKLHAGAGNVESAVTIAWPLTEKREIVLQWLKDSYQQGGSVGARHLVRLAVNDPENQDHYLKKISERLRRAERATSHAIYSEVVNGGDTLINKRIATIASRAYIVDVARSLIPHHAKTWNRLCLLGGDLALRGDSRHLDFCSIRERPALESRQIALEYRFEKAHGRTPSDCIILNNGKVLLAFGEAGVELWNKKGKKLRSFFVPCHRLVVSDAGTHVLFVAVRSGYQVVSRFDATANSVVYWLELELHCWADTYDGKRWLVGKGCSICMLDAGSREQLVLWRVGDLPGVVSRIERSVNSFAAYVRREEGFELWSYQLPNLYLKERTPYTMQRLNDMQPSAFSSDGWIAGFHAEEERKFGVYQENIAAKWAELGLSEDLRTLALIGNWLLVSSGTDDKLSLHLLPMRRGELKPRRLSLVFKGQSGITGRIFCDDLVVATTDGRVVSIDLEHGELLFDYVI